MFTGPLLRGRIRPRRYTSTSVLYVRSYANGGTGRRPSTGRVKRNRSDDVVKRRSGEGGPLEEVEKNTEPSLYEQLFPDQHEENRKSQRESEIPRLPIERLQTIDSSRQAFRGLET